MRKKYSPEFGSLSPHHIDMQKTRYFEEEILEMNDDFGIFGQFSDCSEDGRSQRESKKFITPCAMTYSPLDSSNVHYLVVRDPIEGRWNTGIFYRDHNFIVADKHPGKAIIKAWFVGIDDPGILSPPPKLKLTGATDSLGILLETPDWAKTK